MDQPPCEFGSCGSPRHWLYSQVTKDDPERKPVTHLQATVNWMRALEHEVVSEHGADASDQYQSCLSRFCDNTQGRGPNLGHAAVVEPLFSAFSFSLSLITRANADRVPTWTLHSLIVDWYYSYYSAVRSMLAAINLAPGESHNKVMNAFGTGLQPRLPHPLNMESTWIKNQKFTRELPDYPNSGSSKLTVPFARTNDCCRKMVLGYLGGTADREVEKIKTRLAEKHGFDNFLTADAQAVRNEVIKSKKYNFMHCAFRYRGKANYRDAIYLAYGSVEVATKPEFLSALSATARFAFICALALASVRLGKGEVEEFVSDLKRNLRSKDIARPDELYWQSILPAA